MQKSIITKTLSARPAEVKVWKSRLVADGPEVTQIRAKISSTTEDRDGDEFSIAGLESMIPALRSGKVPYYLDHGYKDNGARNYGALDMIGGWIDGEIVGNALYATAFIDPGCVPGEELARKIAAGLPIGHSVGFGVTKSRNKTNGGVIFDAVSLWEVSAVGIPSNPDAVTAAVKSMRIAAGLDKKKAPADVRRVVLVRTADGTIKQISEAGFRRGIRAGINSAIDKALTPAQKHLETIAGTVKAAKPVTVRSGVNRGKTMRRMVVAGSTGAV